MQSVRSELPTSVRLTNYTKKGEKFIHQLWVEPLRDPAGETRCYQATSLVLQMPGCKEEATPGHTDLPLISDHPTLPPLWPLLGHAIHQTRSPPPLPTPSPEQAPLGREPFFEMPFDVPSQGDCTNDIMRADDILSWWRARPHERATHPSAPA